MQTIDFPPGTDVSLQIMLALKDRPKGERLLTVIIDCYTIQQRSMADDVRHALRAIGNAVQHRRGMRVNVIQFIGGRIHETDVFARNHLEREIGRDYRIYGTTDNPYLSPIMETLKMGKDRNFFVPRNGDNRRTPIVFIGGENYMDSALAAPVYKGKFLPVEDWPNYIHLNIPLAENRPRV